MKLRNQLSKIGVPKPGKPIPRIPSGFHSSPKSLKAMMKAMNDPKPGQWVKTSEREYANEDWTEECQGITHDGVYWYISSNRDPDFGTTKRGIYKFSLGMKKLDFFSIDFADYDHIGDLDYYKGRIYAAMEWPHEIFWVDTDFQSYGSDTLKGESLNDVSPQGKSFAWCAVNPWNGYLYSSKFGKEKAPPVTKIYAYDPSDRFKHKKTLTLDVPSKGIQGGCFSNNGHLLLASNDTHDIRCYSALNGKFLGSTPIQISPGEFEEVEGLTVRKNISMNGKPGQIHLILLDNDWASIDDVYFKHFNVPAPEDL